MNKVSKRNSLHGKGLFANTNLKNKEVIFEVLGKLISCDEDDDTDETTRANTYRYDANFFLSPGSHISNFLNHSCDPNVKVVKRKKKLFVVAIKNVERGAEIFLDYSTIIASDDSWEMECGCLSSICRKQIKSVNKLPKKILLRYLDQKIIPNYIIKLSKHEIEKKLIRSS